MAPRRRPKKNTRADAAYDAMKKYEFPLPLVKKTLKELLEVYEGNWAMIEDDSYMVLLEAIFQKQEENKLEQEPILKKLNENQQELVPIFENLNENQQEQVPILEYLNENQQNQDDSSANGGALEENVNRSCDSPVVLDIDIESAIEGESSTWALIVPDDDPMPIDVQAGVPDDDTIPADNLTYESDCEHDHEPSLEGGEATRTDCKGIPMVPDSVKTKKCKHRHGWFGDSDCDSDEVIDLPPEPLPQHIICLLVGTDLEHLI